MLKRALVLALVLLSAPALAGDKPYLTAKELDIISFLPAPVANGSEGDKAQQAAVIAVQKSASPERIALAGRDTDETVYAMFANVMGEGFKPEALPLTSLFFARIEATEDEVVDPAKAHFGRARPYLNNPEIKPLVKPSKSGSYPSGHTSRSRAMAILLGVMVPEKRDAIFARADDYAFSRIVGGMHYPADLEAGKWAGTAIAAALLSNADVRKDMDAARAELRKALGL